MPDRPLVAIVDAVDRDLPDLRDVETLARVARVSSVAELEDDLEEVDVVPRAPRLRWIQSISAGVEEFARPVLADHGVVLTSAAGVYDPGLAESVLGFLLAFSARILEDARLTPGSWPAGGTRLLRGTTALVVGAGSIGAETGRLLRSVGLRVRGIARTPRPADDVFDAVGGPDDLLDELALADHVVNVLPRTATTERLFDGVAFAAMKPSATFVNIGRGATVDEPALIDALREGRIAAAALDVFAEEPLPAQSPLWTMPNVLVSPHRAGDHDGWMRDVVGLFIDNLRRFVDGRPLRNVVDLRLGYAPADRSRGAAGEG